MLQLRKRNLRLLQILPPLRYPAEQFQPARPKTGNNRKKSLVRKIRSILLILIIIPLALLGLLSLSNDSEKDDSKHTIQENKPAPTTEATAPPNGWQEFNGDSYYFEDGLKYVGLHDISGELYYFDDNGVLVTNREVPYESVVLDVGYDGQVEAVTYEAVYGTWAEKSYRFGNGGSSSILELSSEVENCDSFQFYLESHGERGAKVNGNWKVYIRCNGQWEFVEKVYYSEPSGCFTFTFSTPKTFDAITAHPTVQGNASYSSLFYLKNVHCKF